MKLAAAYVSNGTFESSAQFNVHIILTMVVAVKTTHHFKKTSPRDHSHNCLHVNGRKNSIDNKFSNAYSMLDASIVLSNDCIIL